MTKVRDTYTHAQVESALCVWEWVLETITEHRRFGHREPATADTRSDVVKAFDVNLDSIFSDYGTSAMRDVATHAGVIVSEAWDIADNDGALTQLTNDGFDWEFVPEFCRHLDWEKMSHDIQYNGPTYAPDVRAMLAIMVARRAFHKSAN